MMWDLVPPKLSPSSVLHQSCLGGACANQTSTAVPVQALPLLGCEKAGPSGASLKEPSSRGDGSGMGSATVDLLCILHWNSRYYSAKFTMATTAKLCWGATNTVDGGGNVALSLPDTKSRASEFLGRVKTNEIHLY
ncbi:hypothetical protein EV421DRAFT_1742624 [Armillaria borealis]|uniref:Uncharacterized protein n=1 Tax=Armillaria borealis TaxID=47425 RepID=A0AA39IY78_9AGAR|nr:hypothetical protein EV421DRAFT_1742624 [Armillaria borealis]